jgi:signal transduction histidine kinase/CheY-like chemotaxis protein
VRAVFDSVIYGVSAAVITSLIVSYFLLRLKLASWYIEIAWVIYISTCALAHMALYFASRSPAISFPRRSWRIRLFLTVCLAEGLGWGATPLLVYHSGSGTGELITVLATCGIGSGSVVAFGPYLPAFAIFFITSIGPIAAILLLSPHENLNLSGFLTVTYFFGIGGLGLIFNNNFKETVFLKINSTRIARELALQKDLAEKANLSKSQFLAAASHDLRQPIHAIALYIGALRSSRSPSEMQGIIDKIQSSINDMDILFSGILDISRLDAGAIKFQNTAFAIGELMDRICQDYKIEATSHGLSLHTVTCSKIVVSDPIIVERVLRNLISNAVRYTETGRVLVGCRRRGEHMSLEVWDTGCGIAPEHQERIFEEFYQVQNLERDRTRGLGLGLAIVKRLTRLIDSRLEFSSKIGKGSHFSFTLPLSTFAPKQHDHKSMVIADTQGRGLIAVVDDETAIQDAMSALLEKWGYSVASAGTADALIEALSTANTPPDLVICDYRLRAGETGHDVIRRVRSLFDQTIPALLITGDTAPDRIAESLTGDALVLHKPVPNGKLRAAIISLLSQKGASKDAVQRQDA